MRWQHLRLMHQLWGLVRLMELLHEKWKICWLEVLAQLLHHLMLLLHLPWQLLDGGQLRRELAHQVLPSHRGGLPGQQGWPCRQSCGWPCRWPCEARLLLRLLAQLHLRWLIQMNGKFLSKVRLLLLWPTLLLLRLMLLPLWHMLLPLWQMLLLLWQMLLLPRPMLLLPWQMLLLLLQMLLLMMIKHPLLLFLFCLTIFLDMFSLPRSLLKGMWELPSLLGGAPGHSEGALGANVAQPQPPEPLLLVQVSEHPAAAQQIAPGAPKPLVAARWCLVAAAAGLPLGGGCGW